MPTARQRALKYATLPTMILALSGCQIFEGEAQRAVRVGAREPDSIKFGEIRVCPNDKSGSWGDASGKNAYGGMTGMGSFIYINGRLVVDDVLREAMSPSPLEASEFLRNIRLNDYLAAQKACYSEAAPKNAAVPVDQPAAGEASKPIRAKRKSAAHRYPYVNEQGADITSATDERNFEKYGTTTPEGE